MRHNYMIFGYRVSSAFELNAYESDFDHPDVIIEKGQISCFNDAFVKAGYHYDLEEDLIAFDVPEIGAFEIRNGNTIIVQPVYESNLRELELFIFGSAFGFLMHQNKVFPLHGSPVNLGMGCITLVGHSGAGKSSLASAFVERGYKLLTDDVSRIECIDSVYYVHPSYPSQKIWKDDMDRLAINYDPEHRVISQLDKYYIKSRDRFCDVRQPLIAVIEIVPSEVRSPTLVQMHQSDVLNAFLTHSYRQEVMGGKTDLGAHLRFCSSLSKSISFFRILRPLEGFTVREQVDAILTQFMNT